MGSVEAFVTSLVFNGVIALIILIIYCILRPKYDYVYQPNFKLLTEFLSNKISERKLSLLRKMTLSSSFFAWITPAFKLKDNELYELVGIDGFVYLRFIKLCFKIAVVSFPYAAVVLVPVNILGGNNQSGMNQLTLGNVSQQSDKLWAHLIGVWLFSILVYILLYHEWRVYTKYRQRHLKENLNQHYSVLVTQLPSEVVSFQQIPIDEGLKKLMQKLFPDQVAFCYVFENIGDWQELLDKHDNLVLKLEHSKAVFKEKGERPQHRLKPLCGEKVDSIQVYDEELRMLQDLLRDQNTDATRRVVSSAIITFKTLREASVASQVLWQAKPYNTMTCPAPEPQDIIWKNLEYPLWNRWLRWIIITVLLFLLVVFWMIPVAFVSSIVSLESLQKKAPFLRFVNDLPKSVVGIIEGVLSTIAFVIFFAILPMIARFMSRQEGVLTNSGVATAVIKKLYIFTMVNKFFGSVLAGAFLEKVNDIIDKPTSLPSLLATSLPSVASFFINFIILEALTGHALKLLRIAPLIVCNIKQKWLAKTEREHKMAWTPPSPRYGEMYPNDLFVFIIGVCYCVQSPIVIPFVMLYFGFGYIVHVYYMVYVFQPSFNCGGKMWVTVFNRMVFAVIVFQLLMIGIFGLKNNPVVSILSIPPLFLTFIFYIIINMYWNVVARHMELDDSPLLDEGVDEQFLQTTHERYIRNKKIPSLFALTTDDDNNDGKEDDKSEDDEPNQNEEKHDPGETTGSINMSDIDKS